MGTKKKPKDEELTKAKAQIIDLTGSMQRLQADFENYKKYVEKEKANWTRNAQINFIKNLLPTLDALELALQNTSDKEELARGIELIYTDFFSLLQNTGLKVIKSMDEEFDPHKHEILMQEITESGQDNKIIQELQKGYMFNEDVVRTAKVKIQKVKENKKEDKQ